MRWRTLSAISAVNPSAWRGRFQFGVSDGVGLRHRGALRREKRADRERGDGDQKAAKYSGGQHREFPLAHVRAALERDYRTQTGGRRNGTTRASILARRRLAAGEST